MLKKQTENKLGRQFKRYLRRSYSLLKKQNILLYADGTVEKMNVKELIKKLKEYDEGAEVYIGKFYDQYHFCIGNVENEIIDGRECIFLHEGRQVWVERKGGLS